MAAQQVQRHAEAIEASAEPASSSPRLEPSEFACSICYELLLDPVVGTCGHEWCRSCIAGWGRARQRCGQSVQCPLCRAELLPPHQVANFSVCIRLRDTLEKLFPEQLAARRASASQDDDDEPPPPGGGGMPTAREHRGWQQEATHLVEGLRQHTQAYNAQQQAVTHGARPGATSQLPDRHSWASGYQSGVLAGTASLPDIADRSPEHAANLQRSLALLLSWPQYGGAAGVALQSPQPSAGRHAATEDQRQATHAMASMAHVSSALMALGLPAVAGLQPANVLLLHTSLQAQLAACEEVMRQTGMVALSSSRESVHPIDHQHEDLQSTTTGQAWGGSTQQQQSPLRQQQQQQQLPQQQTRAQHHGRVQPAPQWQPPQEPREHARSAPFATLRQQLTDDAMAMHAAHQEQQQLWQSNTWDRHQQPQMQQEQQHTQEEHAPPQLQHQLQQAQQPLSQQQQYDQWRRQQQQLQQQQQQQQQQPPMSYSYPYPVMVQGSFETHALPMAHQAQPAMGTPQQWVGAPMQMWATHAWVHPAQSLAAAP